MASTQATTAVRSDAPPNPVQFLAELQEARRGTLALVAPLSEQDLERVHSAIMSPLVWDLGHIAAYEDLWLAHRHGGKPLLRPDLADLYDAFETPRAVRGEIDALGPADARAYLQEVRSRTVEVIAHQGLGDGFIAEMVLRHELQHSETMRQTMALAGLLCDEDQAAVGRPLSELSGQEWVEIPAGEFQMGAGPAAFAYDNERPRHRVDTKGFRIARNPVSCESWMRFSDGGGYEQREWWSAEGWAWKQEHRIGPDPTLTAIDPKAPACHISWFEADAFTRAHGARLPSEAEWERAAGANDALAAIGRVWEWTQTPFHGYPGFVAYPYREYSEVFFGDGYRVLRGGSWATNPRVASLTFRNWDLPQRRQIFAGLRLASDTA
jgi:gamma-glutamyl hercynylcysteine S-oxide synthase